VDRELEIQSDICRILLQWSRDRERFIQEAAYLEEKYGSDMYPLFFFTVAHLEFSSKTARKHWNEILGHWEDMNRRLKKSIDLRVVLLDYYLDINKCIKNPKIIETKIFEKTLQETFVDELTQLYNYRFFIQSLRRETLRAKRYDTPLSLAMYDVDDFKHYNDINGHPAGSRALKKLAGIISKCSRDVDIVARYGGEEFAVILPETGKVGALAIAERTRRKIEQSRFLNGEKQPLKMVSVSGGVATLNVDAKAATSLIGKADQALYRAKSLGKNRIAGYGKEKRRFARVNSTVRRLLSVVSEEGDRFEACNISEMGILFQSDTAFDTGANLRLSLDFKNGRESVPFTARVRRVSTSRKKKYEVGASITRVRKEDRKVLKDFVGSLTPP
jgi:diguanylate cyclase (GGDEF)-like protein